MARISQHIGSVEELVFSQDSAPDSHKTIRQIAQNIGISKTSVHNMIVKQDLQESLANAKVSARQPCWTKMDFDMK